MKNLLTEIGKAKRTDIISFRRALLLLKEIPSGPAPVSKVFRFNDSERRGLLSHWIKHNEYCRLLST